MTDAPMTEREEEDALAAEYALGLLSPEEARAFEDLLDIDPGIRSRYAFWAESLAGLTDDIEAVAPPPELKDRVLSHIAPEPETGTAEAAKPSLLQRLGLLPAVAGGLLAALAVLAVVDLLIGDDLAPPLYMAELSSEDQSLLLRASYAADSRTLTVERAAGEALPGRVLELWLIPPQEGSVPISLGVLPADPSAAVAIPPDLVPRLDQGILAISDEPEGGSPTGAPTGAVLATGAITRA